MAVYSSEPPWPRARDQKKVNSGKAAPFGDIRPNLVRLAMALIDRMITQPSIMLTPTTPAKSAEMLWRLTSKIMRSGFRRVEHG